MEKKGEENDSGNSCKDVWVLPVRRRSMCAFPQGQVFLVAQPSALPLVLAGIAREALLSRAVVLDDLSVPRVSNTRARQEASAETISFSCWIEDNRGEQIGTRSPGRAEDEAW